MRTTNTDLLKTKHDLKARIATLEADAVKMQAKVTTAESNFHEVVINGPLREMAQSLSSAPQVFLDEFAKSYRLDLVEGALTVLHADGKPVLGKDGKRVPFEREALTKFLTETEDKSQGLYKAILVVSRASGGVGRPVRSVSNPDSQKPVGAGFGLR